MAAALAAKYHLSPEEVQYELTHLDETKRPAIMAAMGSFSTLATITILLRILVRWHKKNGFKADDYTIFGAFVCIGQDERNCFMCMLTIPPDPVLGLFCFVLLP